MMGMIFVYTTGRRISQESERDGIVSPMRKRFKTDETADPMAGNWMSFFVSGPAGRGCQSPRRPPIMFGKTAIKSLPARLKRHER